jgi:hypothetical protein
LGGSHAVSSVTTIKRIDTLVSAQVDALDGTAYDVELRFDPRIAAQHLGAQKYTTPARALGELIANSLDAKATVVQVEIEEDAFGVERALTVRDNGLGMSPECIRERFALVGVATAVAQATAPRLGRFGVGRFAVHRIGERSNWCSVAAVAGSSPIQTRFSLAASHPGIRGVQHTRVADLPSGTEIRVEELRPAPDQSLKPSRLRDELLAQFCGYLLAHPAIRIEVQGEPLNVRRLVAEERKDCINIGDSPACTATVTHLVLNAPVDRSRFPQQVLLSAKGRTVRSLQPDHPIANDYLCIAECAALEEAISANREALIDFDPLIGDLERAVLSAVKQFDGERRSSRRARFIEAARAKEFYPFQGPTGDGVRGVQQAMFDVVLERVHEHANIENMTLRQQAVIFRLLKRAIENENLLEVLGEVANLSDADVLKFRNVLEKTTLDSILHLAGEVADRLEYLDVLHALVYGPVARHLKERSQLHKIIESRPWLFGAQYHLATSDQSFREIIRRHRALAGLSQLEQSSIAQVRGVEDIPDLFLAASRDHPAQPRHHHLLVELKAPSVTVGGKELDQIRKYARTIQASSEFDKRSCSWDIFLVSAHVSDTLKLDREPSDRPFGQVAYYPNMKLWVFAWSEIITAAREELQLVKDHLRRKSEELSVSAFLQTEFPELLTDKVLKAAS